MTISATRRAELRRLVEGTVRTADRVTILAAVPDLLDEIERLEAEAAKEAAATHALAEEHERQGMDLSFHRIGHGDAQREIERLRTELGEAKLVIEQQDRDLERLRTALGDALDWWSPGELESSDARDTHDRLRKVLG